MQWKLQACDFVVEQDLGFGAGVGEEGEHGGIARGEVDAQEVGVELGEGGMAGRDGAEDGGGVGLDSGAARGDGGDVGVVYGDKIGGGGGLDGWVC